MLQHPSYGGLTFARGHEYYRMAYALALTLKRHGVPLTVVVVNPDKREDNTFLTKLENTTNVIYLEGRYGKFDYEKEAFRLSPYDITLKFDADVIIPIDADLQSLFKTINACGVSAGIAHSLVGLPALSAKYRRVESQMGAPSIYSACFGFTKGFLGEAFFQKVRFLFENWFLLSALAKVLPATTDSIYSIAWCALKHPDLPVIGLPFLHMKSDIAGTRIPERWMDQIPYVLEDNGRLRVNSHQIDIPFHYFDKRFLSDTLLDRLEGNVCHSQ